MITLANIFSVTNRTTSTSTNRTSGSAARRRLLHNQRLLSPAGWIHLSYTLHELHRTQEAWDNLSAVAARFPDNFNIAYNLACYACQLGNLPRARELLGLAIELGGSAETKLMALKDPDLTPLWTESQRT